MSRGWWTLGSFKGAPIRLHFSIVLGALFWSHFALKPLMWLGFVALILIHEFGHALIVLKYRLGLSEIAVHGAGGYCSHERSGSRFEESVIAWGGVLAQLLLWACVEGALLVFGRPTSLPVAELVYVLTQANLWLVLINLIPIGPLDGAKAWPLVGMLFSRWRKGADPVHTDRASRSVQDELRALERLDTRPETPSERTDRLVRELIARTTQPKDR
jgi:stage IV sporulation protein FB